MLGTASSSFRKTTETFVAGAQTLSRDYFVSPEIFAYEQEQIFARQWVLVGHASELARPGDYFLVRVAGESLIILRDHAGASHAFYNVCRHRGTRLCEEERGHMRAIQCPYHAWTYSLEGELTGAPHMQHDFEKSAFPLHEAEVKIWNGFLFVRLERGSAFAETFAPLAGKFDGWDLPQLQSAKRIIYPVNANWKLIVENYSECYHCPGVHPALSKVSPYDSAENDLCEGPFLGGFMSIAHGRSLTLSGRACARTLGDLRDADHHRVFYYSIFPNMLLSLHPDYAMVHQIWPQSPETTLVLCDWYFHPAAFGDADFAPNDAIEFWDKTNREDWHVCELSQEGISSRAYQPGPYSPRESIPAAWDREYLRQLKRAGKKEPAKVR